jgi:hypothetical protein
MSTPIVTARRNLVHRINKLLLNGAEVSLTPWQLRQVQAAVEQLEEERYAEGERTMSEAERPDLYEPAGYVAKSRRVWSTKWPRLWRPHNAPPAARSLLAPLLSVQTEARGTAESVSTDGYGARMIEASLITSGHTAASWVSRSPGIFR